MHSESEAFGGILHPFWLHVGSIFEALRLRKPSKSLLEGIERQLGMAIDFEGDFAKKSRPPVDLPGGIRRAAGRGLRRGSRTVICGRSFFAPLRSTFDTPRTPGRQGAADSKRCAHSAVPIHM